MVHSACLPRCFVIFTNTCQSIHLPACHRDSTSKCPYQLLDPHSNRNFISMPTYILVHLFVCLSVCLSIHLSAYKPQSTVQCRCTSIDQFCDIDVHIILNMWVVGATGNAEPQSSRTLKYNQTNGGL